MNDGNAHYIRCLEALKASSFFNGAEIGSLKELLSKMSMEYWAEGTFKNSSDFRQSFHVIISGRLKVYRINPNTGREHTIFILNDGDVFDILYLLDQETHEIYWEAKDDLELLRIGLDDMLHWIYDSPGIQKNMMQYLGHRMRQLEDAATDISLHSTLVRLSGLILRNINGENHKLELINNLPNEELASLIGTTRAVVNRHIQELKKCGAISVKRKYIDVQNLQTLIAIAEERHGLE
jgi:CRP/FNR family transcriptional regulator